MESQPTKRNANVPLKSSKSVREIRNDGSSTRKASYSRELSRFLVTKKSPAKILFSAAVLVFFSSLPVSGDQMASEAVMPMYYKALGAIFLLSLALICWPSLLSAILPNPVAVRAIALLSSSAALFYLFVISLKFGNLGIGERGTLFRDIALPSLGLVGGYIAIWRGNVASRAADTAAEALSREKLSKALEMLGGDRAATRIGGITILGDLDTEQSQIFGEISMRVLFAFVNGTNEYKQSGGDGGEECREHRWGGTLCIPAHDEELDSDVQEAMKVLARNSVLSKSREKSAGWFETSRSLRRARLQEIYISEGSMRDVYWNLVDCHMGCFSGVDLSETHAHAVRFTYCVFKNCDFSGSQFGSSDLQSARFINCNMEGCSFKGSDITNCRFTRVSGLLAKSFVGATYSSKRPPSFERVFERGQEGKEIDLPEIQEFCEVSDNDRFV